jgi:hypothetical protein
MSNESNVTEKSIGESTRKAMQAREVADAAINELGESMFDFGYDLGYKGAIDNMLEYLNENGLDSDCAEAMFEWVKSQVGK